MTLQVFPGCLWSVPVIIDGLSSHLMNASGEAVAFVFQVPKSGTIDDIVFTFGTVTTGDTLVISLETVGTDGKPTGTDYGGSASVTYLAIAGTDSNTAHKVTLGTSATATVGDLVCVRIEFNSYVAGNLNIRSGIVSNNDFPSVWLDSGSGFTHDAGNLPLVSLGYSDGSYEVPTACGPPVESHTFQTLDSATTPNEAGLWFNCPAAMSVAGVQVLGRELGSTDNIELRLYSSPGGTPTLERTVIVTHDTIPINAEVATLRFAPFNIAANTDYVIVVAPQTTADFRLYYMDVDSATHLEGYNGGDEFHWGHRSGGSGAFSETLTRQPMMALCFSSVDDGAGGGGSSPLNRGILTGGAL